MSSNNKDHEGGLWLFLPQKIHVNNILNSFFCMCVVFLLCNFYPQGFLSLSEKYIKFKKSSYIRLIPFLYLKNKKQMKFF